MYGNPFLNSNQYSYVTDKPQHIMYGNTSPTPVTPAQIADKPQHIMYGNRAKKKQEQISQQG